MTPINMNKSHRQSGASLLEVLVAVLILSFGMLALGGMLSYAVQLPKLSGYRASATALAAGHVERMRANIGAYTQGIYDANDTVVGEALTGTGTTWKALAIPDCAYPTCTATTIAYNDINATVNALHSELPGFASMRVLCSGPCANREGDIWMLWMEPKTLAGLNTTGSDECPSETQTPTFPALAAGTRCLHLKFKL